mmetsp:Transcript_3352/g.3761  ORF Transcript_3352/g.3761 Transcript_3352/m.3761 type:complete len:267 (-) Transcript_3352:404-1204(-)|eukprot:CAMPEP_0197847156 /NCGR_PEP_ID=MMETSP1438-20131217/5332_1 /TAXON_ID=1461541 /ORGANISM="Pterosperma sp., Strain CCMP1384" /LENGTH=266 /DNA_ID=CAMNT_0043459001 /DNA_START=126 /DNA_END=926 /DNA_ORIENTATION=+
MAEQSNTIVVYGIRGSQYVAKVISALQARSVPHYVNLVAVDPKIRTRQLPSNDGSIMVPEMTFNGTVVKDSEAILHFLDEKLGTNYFPPGSNASELSMRVDNGIALYILYYNWIEPEGYKRSLRKSLQRAVPWYLKCVGGVLIDFMTKDKKKRSKDAILAGLNVSEEDLTKEPEMRERFVTELEYFQSLLKSEDQLYFIPGDQPTAADFAVYAQIERMVGDMGDAQMPSGLPELLEEPRLKRFWTWRTNMRENFPLKFKVGQYKSE